jgi:integrase
MIAAYQVERRAEGRAPKTVNGEVSVLRQLLKHARLWYQFQEDYRPIRNTKPSVGRALTPDEAERLFDVARTRPDWIYAYVAATLSFYCGMRACEIKGLQWHDIDWENRLVEIRRSKTPAGWRTPSLNTTCHEALRTLFESASALGAAESSHYVFPWHGREPTYDFTMAAIPQSQRSPRKESLTG